MGQLLLVHDVLDIQLVDPLDEKIGRVDALVLEAVAGAPLRVTAILVGGPARQERIGRWAMWLGRLLRGGRQSHAGLSRIPFAAVRRIAESITVDVDARTLPSEHIERWLCERVVARIPGSEGEQK